jgi:transposase
MDNIVYENSLGNQYDNNGNEIMDVQMEVDNEMYPIEKVTNFDIYIDLKPSEKEAKERNNSSAEKPQMNDKKGSYKHYKDVEKEQLFFLVEEKGMSVRVAAQKLINVRSAQGWVSKNNKDPPEYIQRSSDSGKPVGGSPVLTDEHNNYMIQWANENTDSVVLEDVLDALTEKFGYLQITRSSFYKLLDKSVGLPSRKRICNLLREIHLKKLNSATNGLSDGWKLTWISQAIVFS